LPAGSENRNERMEQVDPPLVEEGRGECRLDLPKRVALDQGLGERGQMDDQGSQREQRDDRRRLPIDHARRARAKMWHGRTTSSATS